MDELKKQHFERENPGKEFPSYETLSPADASAVRGKVALLVGAGEEPAPVALARAVYDFERWVQGPGSNAGSSSFDLLEIFGRLGIAPKPHSFINWRNFETIDRLATADLAKFFDDLWYPGPDEIDLWDDSYCWIISIDADGYIRFAQFPQ